MELDYLDWTSAVFATGGAMVLGLKGLGEYVYQDTAHFNPVAIVSGYTGLELLEPLIYMAVGIAGIYQIYLFDRET